MQSDSNFIFVLFGGTGDLSMRKILPALFEAHRAGMLNPAGRIVSVAREAKQQEEYRAWVEDHVKPHVAKNGIDGAAWQSFIERFEYVGLDLGRPEDFVVLRDALARFERPATVISEAPDPTSTRLIGDVLLD